MLKIRITKEFNFEMAHALEGYDGLCKHIHGHSYKFFVCVIGTPINEESNPKNGMVMDFTLLKQIVKEEIVDVLDHSLMLNKTSKLNGEKLNNEIFQRLVFVDYQPTCENMLIDFAAKIKKRLPQNVKLHHLKLNETATSFAEWYNEDN